MLFAETQYGKFHYFQSDDIGRRIAGGEFFDEHLKPYLDRLKEGDVFVDVGANIGFFSVYAAQRGAIVFAVEPAEDVIDVLSQNIVDNGVADRVTLICCALYDSTTELGINPDWKDWVPTADGKIDYEKSPNSGGLSLVKGTGYKAYPLDQYRIPRISLLKIDTQGADLRVLLGASETIYRCRPVVCFEFEDGGTGKNASGDSLDDFMRFFAFRSYNVTKIHDGMHGSDFVAEPVCFSGPI